MKKKIMMGLSTLVFFTGCTQMNLSQTSQPQVKVSSEPKWMMDPYIEGDKYAAMGCAKEHIKGESEQRKLAVARAVDEIAKSKEATVENVTLTKRSVSAVSNQSSMKSSSLQSVNKVSVSTKVKDTYKKRNGEICVWVVSN